MPLGETIGRAYVRILADGTGFEEDVKRQFRRAQPGLDRQGRELGEQHGEHYIRGFNSAFQDGGDDDIRETLEEALQHGLGRWDAIARQIAQPVGEDAGTGFMDGLERELHQRFPDLSSTIVDNLRKSLAKGDIGEQGLIARLHNLRREVAIASGDIGQEQARAFDEMAASVKRFGGAVDRNGPSRHQLITDLHALRAALPQQVRDTDEFQNKWRETTRMLADAAPRLNAFKKSLEGAGGRIGRLFGKGSRNDFLNFFGSFVGGVAKITQGLSSFMKWPGLAGEALQRFGQKISNAVEEAGGLREALMNMASQGAPGLIGAVVTVGILVKTLMSLMGAFGSAIVLVSGLVLALAGSLAFALVGGLVAVAGALIPFAAAFGVAALAMGNLDKKSKFFKDFQKVWQDFKKTAQTAIFGKNMQGLETFSNVLKALKPIVKTVGGAIGGLLKQLAAAAGSKDFQNWIKDVNKLLGPMIKTIGSIAGNIGTFIGEAFIAAGPIIQEFLGWLDKVTGQLADFGKGGRKSGLADFFDKAWKSAKIVGTLIGEIAGAIGDLFSAGKDTGDSIFVSLTEQVRKFRDWLAKAKADGSLQKMFDDAKELASKIGEIVSAVIGLIDALDTDTNRGILFTLLDVITGVIKGITWVVTKVDQASTAIAGFVLSVIGFFSGLGGKADEVGGFFSDLPGKISGFFTGLGTKITTAAGNLSTAFSTWIGGIWATISAVPGQITGFFSGLADKIWTAAGNLASSFGTWVVGVVTGIPGIISQILTAWSGLDDKIATAMGDMAGRFGTWLAGLPEQAITVVGQIVVGWIGLAGRMITAAGNILGAFTQWLVDLPGKSVQAAVNIAVGFANLAINIFNRAGSMAAAFDTWVAGMKVRAQQFVANLPTVFAGLASRIIAGAGDLRARFVTWVSGIPARARSIVAQIAASFVNLAGKAIAKAGSMIGRFGAWLAGLPGKARQIVAQAAASFIGLAGKMIARAGSIIARFGSWLAGLPGKARAIVQQVTSAFSGLANKAIARAGSIVAAIGRWASGVGARAASVANDIVNAFRGLASRIVAAIGTIIPKIQMPHITIPHITAIVDKPKAAGGIATGPTYGLYGEAGPEALVPLNRPLSQVDPAVRMLSAFAQGKLKLPAVGGGTGRTIDVGGITINTPTEDPRAVASEVVAHMAAAAYI